MSPLIPSLESKQEVAEQAPGLANQMVMKHAALRAAALAGALTSSAAFAPAAVRKLGVPASAHAPLATRADRAGRRAATETKMDMGVANTLAGFPLMYALMSANEYVTHRYYQHNEIGKLELYQTLRKMNKIPKLDGGGHVEHHAETYDDMLLKTDDPVWMKSAPAQRLNSDPWRGTIFTWEVTAMMFAQCVPSVYPAFFLLGWSPLATTALFVPAMILHGLVWNSLHPDMHGLPDVPASIGLPSSVFAKYRGPPVFEFLRLNHVGHHVASGKANYNVCCPGMDHVVGTFMKEEEWTPKIRVKEAKEIEGALASSAM